MSSLKSKGHGLHITHDDEGNITGIIEGDTLYIHYCNVFDFADATPPPGWWLAPGVTCEHCGEVMPDDE